MAKKSEFVKITTPKFRVSFPSVFQPKSFEGQAPKYSVVMLFEKTADLAAMKKAAMEKAIEAFGPKETWPKNFKWPFKNGDDKPELQGYPGSIVVTASCKADNRPGVVDRNLSAITEEDGAFYAGCYARATVSVFPFDKAGNRGVSFGLLNLQKLGDGEAFSGRKAASADFEAIDDGSENAENYDFEA